MHISMFSYHCLWFYHVLFNVLWCHWVSSNPIFLYPILYDSNTFDLVWYDLFCHMSSSNVIWYHLIQSHLITHDLTFSYPIWFDQNSSNLILTPYYLIYIHQIRTNSIQSHFISTNLTRSCVILSHSILPYPI